MRIFEKILGNTKKQVNNKPSLYEIGTAFACLATCAAVSDNGGFSMAIVDNNPDDNTTPFFCGGGDVIKSLLKSGTPISSEKYISIGVPRDTAEFLSKLPFKSNDSIEVQVTGSISVPKVLKAMEIGTSYAKRVPDCRQPCTEWFIRAFYYDRWEVMLMGTYEVLDFLFSGGMLLLVLLSYLDDRNRRR